MNRTKCHSFCGKSTGWLLCGEFECENPTAPTHIRPSISRTNARTHARTGINQQDERACTQHVKYYSMPCEFTSPARHRTVREDGLSFHVVAMVHKSRSQLSTHSGEKGLVVLDPQPAFWRHEVVGVTTATASAIVITTGCCPTWCGRGIWPVGVGIDQLGIPTNNTAPNNHN